MSRINEVKGVVVIDCSGCGSHELSAVYHAFALLCVAGKVRAALLRTGLEDAEAHHTLRDILATVARVVSIPVCFRLALVTSSESIEQVYASMLIELRALGCEARLFHSERAAEHWLREPLPQRLLEVHA